MPSRCFPFLRPGAPFPFYEPAPDQELLTGPGSPGRVVVTRFAPLSRVVSGTFALTARQAAGAAPCARHRRPVRPPVLAAFRRALTGHPGRT